MTIRAFGSIVPYTLQGLDIVNVPVMEEPAYKKRKMEEIASLGAKKILENDYTTLAELEEKPSPMKRESVKQGQANENMRKNTLKQTKNCIHALSPSMLRIHKADNLRTYLILFSKRVAHAMSIDGHCKQLKSYFDCFNETFTLPMLAGSFDLSSGFMSAKKHQSIMQVLQNAIWHDNCLDDAVNKTTEEILNPLQLLPIWVGTGNRYHSSQIIFYKGYFIYCNRGEDCGYYPGFHVYKINNNDQITPDWVRRLSDRLSSQSDDYLSEARIIQDLEATEVFYAPMVTQAVGNCTYTSVKAGILALLMLSNILKDFAPFQRIDASSNFKMALNKALPMYKMFTSLDRQIIIEDLIVGLENIPKLKKCSYVEETDLETAVVKQLADQLLLKFHFAPTMIFKLGPNLWKKLIITCEKVLVPTTSLYKALGPSVESISQIQLQKPNKTTSISEDLSDSEIITLGTDFFKQKACVWFGDDLVWLLIKRQLLAPLLHSLGLIKSPPENIQQYIHTSYQNLNSSQKMQFFYNFSKTLASEGYLDVAEKMIDYIHHKLDKAKSLRFLSKALSKAGKFEKALLIIHEIRPPWGRFFASLTLSAYMNYHHSQTIVTKIENDAFTALAGSLQFQNYCREKPFLKEELPHFIKFVQLLLRNNYLAHAEIAINTIKDEPTRSLLQEMMIDSLLKDNKLKKAESFSTFVMIESIKKTVCLKIVSAYIERNLYAEAERTLKSINYTLKLENSKLRSSVLFKIVGICIEHGSTSIAEIIAKCIECERLRSSAFLCLYKSYAEEFAVDDCARVHGNITNRMDKIEV